MKRSRHFIADGGRGRAVAALMAALMLGAGGVQAAEIDAIEAFEAGTSNWDVYDLILQNPTDSLRFSGDALELRYGAQFAKFPPEHHLLRAGSSASDGAFAGNYVAAGARGCSFRLFASHRAHVRVLIHNETSGGWWDHVVPVAQPGVWTTVRLPFRASYWRNQTGGGDAATLETDLRQVSWIGVAVQRADSLDAQVYRIDDFQLVDDDPAFVDWMAQFNTGGLTTGLKPNDDLDGDGVSNHEEWIAGTDAGDDTQYLLVVPGADAAGGIQLRWASVAGKRYRVLRSDSLADAFAPIGSALDATPPENEFSDNPEGNQAYYYCIEVWDPLIQQE